MIQITMKKMSKMPIEYRGIPICDHVNGHLWFNNKFEMINAVL